MDWSFSNAFRTTLSVHCARWREWTSRLFLSWRLSLELRLLSLTIGAVVVGMAGASLVSLPLQHRQLIANAQLSAQRVTNVLSTTIEYAMLSGEPRMVDRMLSAIADEAGAEHIRIIDNRGKVLHSCNTDEEGQIFQLSDPICVACHTGGAFSPVDLPASKVAGGRLLNAIAIPGESQCYRCHDPGQRVLGVLLVETTLVDLHTRFNTSLHWLAAALLCVLCLLVIVLVPALQRLIVRPLTMLTQAAAGIGGGNLETPVDHARSDELGQLGATLDGMREQLRAARRALEQRNAELQMLNVVAHRASELLDPRQVLELSIDLVVGIPDIAAGVIFLADPDCGRLAQKVSRGMSDEQCARLAVQQQSILRTRGSLALLEGRVVYVPEAPAAQFAVSSLPDGSVCSWISVPLLARGNELGRMALVTNPECRLTEEGIGVLRQMGEEIGLALANAFEYRRAFFVGATEERERLAREMHDSLAQTLGYLKLKAAITDQLLAKGDIDNAQAHLREVKEIAGSTYTDVRETIFGLRYAGTGGDFWDDLQAYLADYRKHYGFEVTLLGINGLRPVFSPPVTLQVTRILQEALANARKHAGVAEAVISISETHDAWEIAIEDQGLGFDLDSPDGHGTASFGLQIMRERAESIGGNLDLETRPGHGTRVTLRLPYSADSG